MISHLEGKFTTITPTFVVLDVNGVGYEVHISLYTHLKIKDLKQGRLLTYLNIREDAHVLFGFFDENERNLFKHLISVNGVGPSTGRMILSSLTPSEIQVAITTGNIAALTAIKGVGPKSAQRLILELQDKLKRETIINEATGTGMGNVVRMEALAALTMLGFSKSPAEKEVDKQLRINPMLTVEELIKLALKNL
jgi:Holliday junction DNA helicase RuvA